jgi:hypothetical protein
VPPGRVQEHHRYLADLLRCRLKAIRSPFRSLPPGRIAVLVLAIPRHDQRLLDLAGRNGIPESTLRRWRDEMVDLLAARAPRLDRALKKIVRRGGEVVLIDGTLIPTQRRTGQADRLNYPGKHHCHDLHFLALTDEKGRPAGTHPRRHRHPPPATRHPPPATRHPPRQDRRAPEGRGDATAAQLRGADLRREARVAIVVPSNPPPSCPWSF